jgi:4-amino-4-deoxy-L-arabinose transferase-like glycosyltransferase
LPRIFEKLKRTPLTTWIALGSFVFTLVIAARLELRIARIPTAIGFDEGYTAALAERMIDGKWLPYVDGVSHRGPLLYWLQAIAELIGGRYSWAGTRWLAFTTFMLTLVLLGACGVAARRPLSGSIAVLFYVYVVGFVLHPGDGIAVRGEPIATPFTLLALLFTTLALGYERSARARIALLVATGFCAALAALVKQTLLPLIGPLWLWVLASTLSAPAASKRERRLTIAAPLVGWLVPFVIVLLRYALSGELSTFFYWYVQYNAEVYLGPYTWGPARLELSTWLWREPWAFLGAALILLPAVARVVAMLGAFRSGNLARAYTSAGYESTLAVVTLVLFLTTSAGFRLWPHYFVTTLAWFALIIGARFEQVVRLASRKRRVIATAIATTLLCAFVALAVEHRLFRILDERRHGVWQPARPDPLCDFVQRHSQTDDAIFIWGFDADLYITCRRRPASVYLYSTLVAGAVPPFWNDLRPQWVARGAQERLAGELRSVRPAVVLDMPGRIGNVSALIVRAVREVLESEYCRHSIVGAKDLRAADVWLLKSSGSCPPTQPPGVTDLKLLLPPVPNPAAGAANPASPTHPADPTNPNPGNTPDMTAPSIPPQIGRKPLTFPIKPVEPQR